MRLRALVVAKRRGVAFGVPTPGGLSTFRDENSVWRLVRGDAPDPACVHVLGMDKPFGDCTRLVRSRWEAYVRQCAAPPTAYRGRGVS
jgi:hypothetical protein